MGAMLRNREGRRVIVDPARFGWYITHQGYERIPYLARGRTSDTGRVAVVREVGGLGDVICVQSVVSALQARGLEVTLYTPRKFWPVCIADRLVDTTTDFPKPGPEWTHDWVYNMFCPAGDYEAEIGMRPTKGRIRNFCEAAEVEPAMPPIARLFPVEAHDNGGVHIGVQPLSENPSKDLTRYQVELIRRGLAGHAKLHVFHDKPLDVPLGCAAHIGHPLPEVIRLVQRMDAMIAVDSGLLHLAAVLDVPTVGLFGPTNGPITCEFYPGVSIFQGGQPDDHDCYTPCYYAMNPNGYACRKRTGRCMGTLDMAHVASEALRRARNAGAVPWHRIPEHWRMLNYETPPHHGEYFR